MSEELKACPFCGADDLWLREIPGLADIEWKSLQEFSIQCTRCYAVMKRYYWQNRPIEDALRAELVQAQARIKELEKIIRDNAGLIISHQPMDIQDIETKDEWKTKK